MIALRRKAEAWGANEDQESITSLSGRWEALSNWFPAQVVLKGVQYPSVEHAFQCAKAAGNQEAVDAIRRKLGLVCAVRTCRFHIARTLSLADSQESEHAQGSPCARWKAGTAQATTLT